MSSLAHVSAVDGDRLGGSERHVSNPTRRPAGKAAGLPTIPTNEQRDDEVPEASAVNAAPVAAYRLSVPAGAVSSLEQGVVTSPQKETVRPLAER